MPAGHLNGDVRHVLPDAGGVSTNVWLMTQRAGGFAANLRHGSVVKSFGIPSRVFCNPFGPEGFDRLAFGRLDGKSAASREGPGEGMRPRFSPRAACWRGHPAAAFLFPIPTCASWAAAATGGAGVR